MNYRIYIFLVICFAASAVFANNEDTTFILITSLYNETNEQRMQEYSTCLNNNLAHPLIKKIIVFYDTSQDNATNTLLSRLSKTNSVDIQFISGRPTFGNCFALANQEYPNNKIIIANADIYFNETLSQLLDYDLNNKFLALTRWNVQPDQSLKMYYYKNNRPATVSQDTWIFQSPIKQFRKTNIMLGTQHCDGKIAYQAKNAGLRVSNPCYTIQTCHLHLSDIRHYAKNISRKDAISVAWSHLKK